jgi:type II secretory pathway pseudopilin PulG
MRPRRLRTGRPEGGETLLELVISIAILGVVVIAVASGISLSIMASGVHRKLATAGAYVRDYAESIESSVARGGYLPCATGTGYPGFARGGYTGKVSSVDYWDGAKWTSSCTAGTDTGVQRLTLQVASRNGGGSHGGVERLVIVVRKPCGTGSSCT